MRATDRCTAVERIAKELVTGGRVIDKRSAEVGQPNAVLGELINKRLTLNLLIQGAAGHACLTAHHLVRPDLEAIRPGLTAWYDKMAVFLNLQYWHPFTRIIFGNPVTFWNSITRSDHPFYGHTLLTHHGARLAAASLEHSQERARVKRMWLTSFNSWFWVQIAGVRIIRAEKPHKQQLARLAGRANSLIWGIPESLLDAELTGFTGDPQFGVLSRPQTFRGQLFRAAASAYGGVMRRHGRLVVVAKANMWPLLSHELVKGTAELVCLHGLNRLDRLTYLGVVRSADQAEHEIPMLQAGPDMWRRFLAVLPPGKTVAEALMAVAKLPPQPLEELMFAVIEEPERARRTIDEL